MTASLSQARVGDALPVLTTTPISRLDLALYCGASGDHNPIHVDLDFARAAGQDDVFAHGMLSMAYLGRLLTGWAPQHQLRRFEVRFVSITHIGDAISCQGEVTAVEQVDGETRVRVALTSANQNGDIKLKGEAEFGLPN